MLYFDKSNLYIKNYNTYYGSMLLPCEVAVKTIIPAIRGSLARIIYKKYRLRQEEIAKIVGVTQSAVSHYIRGTRGMIINLIDIEDVYEDLEKLADDMVNNKLAPEEIIFRFCRICYKIKKKRLLCELHRKYEAKLLSRECKACMG